MNKSPVSSSLYYYNKSKKAHKSAEKQFISAEHDVKESSLEKTARKSFFLAYFASRNNK